MKYRKLGRTGLNVSEIGLGLEHLMPQNQNRVTETIQTAVAGGVNYIDCLSHNHEDFAKLGHALEGLRDKVYITYIAYYEKSLEETKLNFENFLRNAKTDYVDIFIIACCDKTSEYERVTGDASMFEYAHSLQRDGKIKYMGFSTHSSNIAFKVIESGNFDLLMYPVNPAFDVITNEKDYISDDLGKLWDAAYDYSSKENDMLLVRKRVFTECRKNNIGLVAMKPFAGGFLFRSDVNSGFTPVNLISYALSQNGISVVIPGCSNKNEMENILSYYSCSDEERDYSGIISKSRWNVKGNCQYCSHCLPCRADINIAQVNRMVDNSDGDGYKNLISKASECVKCGDCEKRCPFDVKIRNKMDLAVKMFE